MKGFTDGRVTNPRAARNTRYTRHQGRVYRNCEFWERASSLEELEELEELEGELRGCDRARRPAGRVDDAQRAITASLLHVPVIREPRDGISCGAS